MKHSLPSATARRSLARVFRIPLLLLAASVAGLVIGLNGDGWPDLAACALLLLPLLTVALAWLRRG